MNIKVLAAAVSAVALLGAAGSASATVYNLNAFQAGFTPPLGTVTVTGENTNVLSFDVSLTNTTFFQLQGNGDLKDAFWFDLTGLVGGTSVAYNITTPNLNPAPPGGDYTGGGLFTGANFSNNAYGQGFLSGYDYAIQVQDTVTPPVDYYTGHLIFTVTAGAGSMLNLVSRSVPVTGGTATVFGGADLRDCTTTDPTAGTCVTGPVGFTLTQGPRIPEPATWAMMIMGFGGIGALMRRRRMALAAI
jgi:hypothetical protein